eukprot:TRINITY_DN2884_c0_g1_i1.p1 TRINITY_DN2884_c0_g1~~TRINITY_DN2884_c0_g1_i1.p1  ORF type:complete len:405 (+),score=63.31 TRINITY_DN2884_c0_g1_i1:102-1316(+)
MPMTTQTEGKLPPSPDSLLVRICTWNVAEITAANLIKCDLIKSWVRGKENDSSADVIVIGLQEVDMSANALVREKTKKGGKWGKMLSQALSNENYTLVDSRQLMGLALFLFCRDEIEMHLENVEVVTAKTGFFNRFGNKGGVCARFWLNGRSFCFINSHLAAHHSKVSRRNKDHDRIVNIAAFTHQPQQIMSHDYVFWFGDLNYRLNLTRDEVVNSLGLTSKEILMSSHDQLSNEMQRGRVFFGFREPPIAWAPTYKCIKNCEGSYSNKRSPAYCDRILYCDGYSREEAEGKKLREPDSMDSETSVGSILATNKKGMQCTVCFRDDRPGKTRKSGWKCTKCIGKKSNQSSWALSTFPDEDIPQKRKGRAKCPKIRNISYTDHPEITPSDHRPVHGLFAVPEMWK